MSKKIKGSSVLVMLNREVKRRELLREGMSDINDFKDLIIWQKGWILLKDAISSLKFFPKMSCIVWFNRNCSHSPLSLTRDQGFR
jgi:hypothetical protein